MAKILFSSTIKNITNGDSEREISASTVKEALETLAEIYGEKFRKGVFGSSDKLKRFINIYVNNKDIRFLNGLETKISENDEILILPAVSGG
jgi:MoaD family protein